MRYQVLRAAGSWLRRTLDGGRNELSRDNLLRQVVDGIVRYREYGERGSIVLPPEVEVRVDVATHSIEVIREFLVDPDFDEEVGKMLLNRLVRVPLDQQPLRHYTAAEGDKDLVVVDDGGSEAGLAFQIQGGDRDGQEARLPRRRTVNLGRGGWHADGEPNHVMVTAQGRFVSRRAARLRRLGAFLKVRALDQEEHLIVRRSDGECVRPARTVDGWVLLRPGDAVEFEGGGDGERVCLVLQRARREGETVGVT